MICRICGLAINEVTKTCPKCGNPIPKEDRDYVPDVSTAPKPSKPEVPPVVHYDPPTTHEPPKPETPPIVYNDPPPTHDSSVFCVNCGAKLSQDVKFCAQCGTPVNSTVPPPRPFPDPGYSPYPPHVTGPRVRHGFTSFWLIGGVIFCPLLGLSYVLFADFLFYEAGLPYENSIITGILLLLQTVCYILLLNWKKLGYWLMVAFSGLAIILNIAMGGSIIFQIIVAPISLFIFWLILNIRKNGKTTWEQLQ